MKCRGRASNLEENNNIEQQEMGLNEPPLPNDELDPNEFLYVINYDIVCCASPLYDFPITAAKLSANYRLLVTKLGSNKSNNKPPLSDNICMPLAVFLVVKATP